MVGLAGIQMVTGTGMAAEPPPLLTHLSEQLDLKASGVSPAYLLTLAHSKMKWSIE